MAFFRPYFSDKMQSHKYSCHSLITPKSTENAGRLQKNHRTLAKKNPQNFISVLPSWHRKKKKGQIILFLRILFSHAKDKADFPTEHHAGQEHMPNTNTHFFGNRFSVLGKHLLQLQIPYWVTYTHTHTQFTRDLKQKNYKKILKFLC